MAVNVHRLAEVADFVGKGNLKRMKGITGTLDHLSNLYSRRNEWCLDVLIKLLELLGWFLSSQAHDRKGRMIVVSYGSTLTKKLRVEADIEVAIHHLAR